MKVTICRPLELGQSEIDLWHAFQLQSPALHNAFLTPEFARVMSRRMPHVRVAVIEEDNSISGFFAFETLGFGVGRALCYGMSDAQAIVHSTDAEIDGRRLLAACGIDIWEFDHLVGEQKAMFSPQQIAMRESPVVDLRNGYESWFNQKKSEKHFKQILQRQRKLEREQGAPRFHYDVRSEPELELLMKWKSGQYIRTGRRDRFARPWFADSVRELFETRSNAFSVNLSTLYVQEKPAAFALTLVSNGVMSGWIPAYDTALASYGPGLILRMNLLKSAAENQIRLFDSGAGDHEYKNTFSNFNLHVAGGLVSRPSFVTYARRLQTFPARFATDIVLGNPHLRKVARESLAWVGSIRSSRRGN